MRVTIANVPRIKTEIWLLVIVAIMATVVEVSALNGPNVCMVKQKYNITKRVKYRAPMSVRTYEWCFSMPPRCSRWSTEMRDLTRLETEERTAEVAVCCPGYKMREVSCVPICPNGKTGHKCAEDCPPNKWGPNCVNDCQDCNDRGTCSPINGQCLCQEGWQGESCEERMPPTTESPTTPKQETLTIKPSTKPTTQLTTVPIDSISARSIIINSTDDTTTSFPITTTPSTISTTIKRTTLSTTTERVLITESTVGIPMPKSKLDLMVPKRKVPESTTVRIPITVNTARIPITVNTMRVPITASTRIITTTSKITTPSTTTTTTTATTTTIPIVVKEIETTTEKTTAAVKIKTTTPNIVTKQSQTPIVVKEEDKINSTYNRTESPLTSMTEIKTETTPVTNPVTKTLNTTVATTATETITTTTAVKPKTFKMETSKKPETTVKLYPTTVKFKPKEIWIRPAQKGESFIDSKIKLIHEQPRHKIATKKELVPTNTTPKTIIVSIIPTSISYSTFKRIALTTASYITQRNNVNRSKPVEQGFTKAMSVQTSTLPPVTLKILNSFLKPTIPSTAAMPSASRNVLKTNFKTTPTQTTKPISVKSTNSMLNAVNTKPTSILTTTISPLTNATTAATVKPTQRLTTAKSVLHTTEKLTTARPSTKAQVVKSNVTMKVDNKTSLADAPFKVAKTVIKKEVDYVNDTKTVLTNAERTNPVTDDPTEGEETFHILTEPEHITAVMGDKGAEHTSLDLVSVISIAGGVMMAIITVAVVIVMIERCRRPRYEDVRKVNDIRMQVMIDNNDVPPPYVRSIFHTPLPEPPAPEKCHYQPISTLDRNLKQFMRPVVVQTISPLMLENFRGILECHYDHLPRRSQEFGTMPTRYSVAPSMNDHSELRLLRAHSVTESTIEALKCEAKLDVIDNTTSEPLYAEIPCWRPPSEHAIEIVNLNGEAVTEL